MLVTINVTFTHFGGSICDVFKQEIEKCVRALYMQITKSSIGTSYIDSSRISGYIILGDLGRGYSKVGKTLHKIDKLPKKMLSSICEELSCLFIRGRIEKSF